MNKTSLNEEISQIKIYTPGCQILYKNTIDLNEKYFVFSATMSIIIYSLKTKRLINIITSNSEKYLRIAALNKEIQVKLLIFTETTLKLLILSKIN